MQLSCLIRSAISFATRTSGCHPPCLEASPLRAEHNASDGRFLAHGAVHHKAAEVSISDIPAPRRTPLVRCIDSIPGVMNHSHPPAVYHRPLSLNPTIYQAHVLVSLPPFSDQAATRVWDRFKEVNQGKKKMNRAQMPPRI